MYVYMHNMRHEMRKKNVLLSQKILLLMLHPFSFFFLFFCSVSSFCRCGRRQEKDLGKTVFSSFELPTM